MNDIDSRLVKETIEDLKTNPEACTTVGGMAMADGTVVIPESMPGEKLSKFIRYLYDNDLINENYLEDRKKIEDKDISELSVDETLTELTSIIRGDRFCSSLLKAKVDDGTVLKLLENLIK